MSLKSGGVKTEVVLETELVLGGVGTDLVLGGVEPKLVRGGVEPEPMEVVKLLVDVAGAGLLLVDVARTRPCHDAFLPSSRR